MAGDWIKMRVSLQTHPKVLQIAGMLAGDRDVSEALSTGCSSGLGNIVTRDVTRDVTLASLLRVWGATNEHTNDGVWHGLDLDDLDQIAGIPHFGELMEAVGWAVYDEENHTVTLPNFLEYNAPAKSGRGAAAARQKRYRERKKRGASRNEGATRDVTRDVTDSITRDVTRDVEKRREEKSTNTHTHHAREKIPEGLEESWERWQTFREAIDGKRIPAAAAEQQLFNLEQRGIEKARRDIAFSIDKNARSVLDSDHDFQNRNGGGGGKSRGDAMAEKMQQILLESKNGRATDER